MFSSLVVRALIRGIINADNATKQDIGQRFARHLRLTPGPLGADDGIDGQGEYDGQKVHFQCKLRSTPLDKDDARLYYSDLKYHEAKISVMLAGVGYKETFAERLFGHSDIGSIRIHLLTLSDLFGETPAYKAALNDMPQLAEATAMLANTAPPTDEPLHPS